MMDLALRLLHGDAPHKIPAGAPVRRIKYVEPDDDGTDTEQVEQLSYEEALVARRQRILDALKVNQWRETADIVRLTYMASERCRYDLHWLVRNGFATRKTAPGVIFQGSTGWWKAKAEGQRVPPAPEKKAARAQKPRVRIRISAEEMEERRERVLAALSCAMWRETAEIARATQLTLAVVYTDLRRLEFSQRVISKTGKSAVSKAHTVWWRAR